MVFRGDRQGFRVREKGRVRPAVFSFHSPCSGEAYSRIPWQGESTQFPYRPAATPAPPPDWNMLIRWCHVTLDGPLQPRDAAATAVASTTRATEV